MENRLERHPCIDFSAPFFDALIGLLPRLAEMAYDDPIGFPVRYIETVMNHILLLHSAPLDSVRFDIPYQGDHNDLVQGILNKVSIEQSINRAAMKEVKRVAIHRKGTWRSRLPPSLLACNLLRVLEIEGFQFRQIPRNFRGFMFLKACSFCEVTDLTDERLQQLIALCPLLEKLKVKRCVGLSNLHTRAPNLIYLYLGACSMEEITSHCPLLVELIMKNCMTLCKMELNSSQFLQEMEELDPSSLEMIPALQCLNKLSLRIGLEIPFGVLISTFPDLEELKITDILIQIGNRIEQHRDHCNVH